jgi:hypothetical protein
MKMTIAALLAVFLTSAATGAAADPWKDESGKGKGHGREYKEEYWDGNCKVERKFKKDGQYKEKRKCKGPREQVYRYYEPVVHERVYYPAYAAPVRREPEVSIDVRIRP